MEPTNAENLTTTNPMETGTESVHALGGTSEDRLNEDPHELSLPEEESTNQIHNFTDGNEISMPGTTETSSTINQIAMHAAPDVSTMSLDLQSSISGTVIQDQSQKPNTTSGCWSSNDGLLASTEACNGESESADNHTVDDSRSFETDGADDPTSGLTVGVGENSQSSYFPPFVYASSDLPPTPNSQLEGYSTLDFNLQTAPYLSPQHAAAAVEYPAFFSPVSPDYPPWATHPSGQFDLGASLGSPADTANNLKFLEQDMANLALISAMTGVHPLDFANYQAQLGAAANPHLFSPNLNNYGVQHGSVSHAGKNYHNQKSRHRSAGGNSMQPHVSTGALANNLTSVSNAVGATGGMSHYQQSHNPYYHRQPQHQMLDIGTWQYGDEINASNKTLTRSGKIVPTPSEKENEVLHKLRQQNDYNPTEFDCNPKEAKFFVIKSYSEDDIHRSIKYNIWCSTDRGNRKLNEAYNRIQGKGPLYLMYSVNGSGHFCGVAEMKSYVDLDAHQKVWSQSKWKGSFDVKWIFVKDVPNSSLRHIRLENNENKPVTNSRDTQEIPFEKGKLILKTFHKYEHATSLFDDFSHYESREKEAESQNHFPEPSGHGRNYHHSGSSMSGNRQFPSATMGAHGGRGARGGMTYGTGDGTRNGVMGSTGFNMGYVANSSANGNNEVSQTDSSTIAPANEQGHLSLHLNYSSHNGVDGENN